MGVKLAAASGGSIELVPTNTASNFTVTVPAVTATALTDSAGILNIGSGQIYKDASGNVGIGTSSPASDARLTLSSPNTESYVMLARSNSGVFDVAIGNNGGSIAFKGGADSGTVAGLSEFARIDSSGNLLLGTTTQAGKLNVLTSVDNGNNSDYSQTNIALGNAAYPAYIKARRYGGSYANGLDFYYTDASTTTSTLGVRIDSSGNVGIGTTSNLASSKLDVRGRIRTGSGNSSGDAELIFSNYASATTAWNMSVRQDVGGANNDLKFLRFDSSGAYQGVAMQLDTSGNLLVGTTSASAKFSLNNGAAGNLAYFTDGVNTDFYIKTASSIVTIGPNAGSTNLAFQTSGTERARIDSSGNLLVGTTSTTGRIGSKAATTDNTGYGIYVEDSAAALMFYARNDGVISTGAKTASPYNNTTASAANMFVSSAGILQRSTSSLKYKTNVQDAAHGLAELLTLRSVTYEGKTDGSKVFGGLIAEEIHEAGLTEFVQYAEDGSPDALAYGNMVSLCIKAIQEQQALIVQLQADVAALKGAQA
jgi:hypothetical protein